jgi:hypothetical protein
MLVSNAERFWWIWAEAVMAEMGIESRVETMWGYLGNGW